MAQDALFGIVDGDERMFDVAPYEAVRPVREQRGTVPTLAEITAEAQRVHDLWRERLEPCADCGHEKVAGDVLLPHDRNGLPLHGS